MRTQEDKDLRRKYIELTLEVGRAAYSTPRWRFIKRYQLMKLLDELRAENSWQTYLAERDYALTNPK